MTREEFEKIIEFSKSWTDRGDLRVTGGVKFSVSTIIDHEFSGSQDIIRHTKQRIVNEIYNRLKDQ